MKRLGIISMIVGAVLAISSGAFAMALATGHLDGGGAELFSIIFVFMLAVGFLAVGIYLLSNAIAQERSEVRSQ